MESLVAAGFALGAMHPIYFIGLSPTKVPRKSDAFKRLSAALSKCTPAARFHFGFMHPVVVRQFLEPQQRQPWNLKASFGAS